MYLLEKVLMRLEPEKSPKAIEAIHAVAALKRKQNGCAHYTYTFSGLRYLGQGKKKGVDGL